MASTHQNRQESTHGGGEGRVRICRRIRGRLSRMVSNSFKSHDGWMQRHIAGCPRCQKRFAAMGRVDLAMSLIKAEPHKLSLLMRANAQAVRVLNHNLREAPQARKLETSLPGPTFRERWGKYSHSAVNAAACIAILLLMKIGIFSSMGVFEQQGNKAVESYYARCVGQDMTDDIFTA